MRRTVAPGNDSNRYTEGNPAMGIPATVVSAEAANGWQEEIVNTIEAAGLTPSTDEDQLLAAILILAGAGGTQFTTSIANNQVAAANLTGLLFDETTVKAARISFVIDRQTATQNVQEVGEIFVVHDNADDLWRISVQSQLDSAGLVFSIDSSGQVKYTSSNLTGASYQGSFRCSVNKINL